MMPGRIAGSCELQMFLRRCRRRFYVHHLLRGLAVAVLTGVTGTGLLLLWDFLRPAPGAVRLAGVVVVLVLTGWTAVRCMLLPAVRGISDEELGAAVDLAAPELGEAVATLVSVDSPDASPEEAGSFSMREALWKQTRRHLETAGAALMDPRTTARFWIPAVVALVVVTVPLLPDPAVSGILLKRLFDPLGNHETASRLTFRIVSPGSVAARGSDVRFAAVPVWRSGSHGQPPEEAVLLVKTEDGHVDRVLMRYQSGKGQYTALLRGVNRNLLWRIQAGRAATKEFRLQVVSLPQIAAAVLSVTPPKYSGRAEQVFPEAAGTMEVLAGSRVRIVLKSTEPVAAARLEWLPTGRQDRTLPRERTDASREEAGAEPADRMPFQISGDGHEARLEFPAARSGPFRFVLTDAHGLEGRDEISRILDVSADRPPTVRLSGLSSVEAARPDDVLVLRGEAEDDVGLATVELHVRRGAAEACVIPADALEHGDRGVDDRFRIDLSEYALTTGDSIQIQLRAVDVCQPDPHEVWSDVTTVMVNPEADPPGSAALSQDTRELIEHLEEARQELSRDLQQVRRLQRQSHEDWEASGALRAERQSEEEQVLGSRLDETAERMANHPLMRPAAGQVRQLAESLRHGAAGHLKHAAQQPAESAATDLLQAEQQLADARNQLSRIIDDLRAVGELEQDLAELKRLADQAAQLADDAADLRSRQTASERGDAAEEEGKAAEPVEAPSADLAAERIEQRRQQLQQRLAELLRQQDALREAAGRALREHLQQAAGQAGMLADRQRRIREGTEQDAGDDAAGEEERDVASAEDGESALSPAAKQTLQRVQELAEAAASFETDRSDAQNAQDIAAAELARRAEQAAGAGQFAEAAQQLRAAGRAARREREQDADIPADEFRQREHLEQQLQLTAGLLDDLARDADVRRSVRMQAQSELASAVPSLAAELETLSRQTRLPQIGLQDEQPAVEAARQAAQASGQAAAQADAAWQAGQIQDGIRQAQAAEAGLRRLQNLAQQAAGGDAAEEAFPQVPREVGQRVTEALDHLIQAAPVNGGSPGSAGRNSGAEVAERGDPAGVSAGQQEPAGDPDSDVSGDRPGDRTESDSSRFPPSESSASFGPSSGGQDRPDGDGVPSGRPGGAGNSLSDEQTRELAAAAEVLSSAAMRSLPRLDTLRAVAGAQGGWSEPDDPVPPPEPQAGPMDPGVLAASQREWARLNEDLTGGLLSGESEQGDQRYENRIRAYFRELARRTARQP